VHVLFADQTLDTNTRELLPPRSHAMWRYPAAAFDLLTYLGKGRTNESVVSKDDLLGQQL